MQYYTMEDYIGLVVFLNKNVTSLNEEKAKYKLDKKDKSENSKEHHKHDKIFRQILNNKKEVAILINQEIKPENEVKEEDIEKYETKYIVKLYKEKQADATIAVLGVPLKEASRFGIMNTNDEDVIIEFEEKPAKPKSNLASMGIYIFTYKTLRKYLVEDMKKEDSNHDFGKDIIPAYLNDNKKLVAYRFKGYWKDVGTIDSLWEANMDLLDPNNELDLSDSGWKIYTEDVNVLPQYIGENATIDNAYINQGCVVDGTVKNSVIFTNARIAEGAKVIDSVIMPNAVIGKNATVTRCIVAEGVEIKEGVSVGKKDSEHIELVAKKVVE